MSQPGGVPPDRIVLRGGFPGGVEVIGDPARAEPSVAGPHTAFREGGTLVVEGMPGNRGHSVETGRLEGGVQVVVQLDTGNAGGAEPVIVRAPPELPLGADLPSASLRISGMRGPIAVSLQAGALFIEDLQGSVDARLVAGTARVTGAPAGQSRIICETGLVEVVLAQGIALGVDATCGVGSVSWLDPAPEPGASGNQLAVRVGTGLVRLRRA